MIEFESILETYSLEGYSMYSHSIADARWGDKNEAYGYLSRFWLPLAEYSEKWKPIQDRIFIHQDSGLPNVFTRPQEWSWRFEGDFVGILPSWMMSGQDR
jgi:hypothetical protein